MSRYLKQEDVLNRIADAYSEHGEQVPMWLHIGDLPSADVVPVVRCKDCKYNKGDNKCLNLDSIIKVPSDDDYCSYGEKKRGQEEWQL